MTKNKTGLCFGPNRCKRWTTVKFLKFPYSNYLSTVLKIVDVVEIIFRIRRWGDQLSYFQSNNDWSKISIFKSLVPFMPIYTVIYSTLLLIYIKLKFLDASLQKHIEHRHSLNNIEKSFHFQRSSTVVW